jgi:phospholipid transport system transporter-binding protein
MLLLPSKLTINEARDTQRLLAQGLQSQTDAAVVINASGLQQFDTSALAVLLECQRLAQAFGKGFEVRDAPPKLSALAKLYGVDVLLLGAAASTTL